ncbi:phenylacetic acid degradation protein PaaN [Thauera aromatica]|nr:phenylacetic acid degradation protein PaaN [Thauera aromatica]MCK2125347.1 phenylacetic acid degradation protein PaaN [Thauera aromatica]
MSHPLFEAHKPTLDAALSALRARGYWTPYAESPSPRSYGEDAAEAGKRAFESHLGRDFVLDQPGQAGWAATERSPYGVALDVRYPVCAPDALIGAAEAAMPGWRKVGAEGRVGICLEILQRLNRRSFEIAHAVMMTTGQGWMMAFQAGGAHAQDRGLEAVATAWDEMSRVPAEAVWEKPQGKNPPLRLRKHFEIVGRGVALVIGCGTFPTWNTYPGLFAALATGNPVIVKPHENAILPAAISVAIAREVLAEQGLDPNLVTLAVVDDPAATRHLATHRAVKSIDFTGSTAFGNWLLDHARQAQVYAELAGVNNVVIESTDNYKGMLKNLAFTLSLYAGQMCTTTQAIIVPAGGIDTDQGRKRFDEVAADLGAAVARFLSDESVATAVLGAIQSPATLARIEEAHGFGQVVLASKALTHAEFPQAQVRTPVIVACDAADEAAYMEERFGPISFVVRAADTDAALALSERIVRERGALTVGLYSTRSAVIEAMTEATLRAGVALSLNLAGGVFVNQSAAFSDYHGVGMNPAANASYADAAFVANRFRVVQRRYHID